MNSATLAIGNGYPVEQCTRGDGGCWQEPRWRLGYDCVGGIRFRYYFMLIPDTVAAEGSVDLTV